MIAGDIAKYDTVIIDEAQDLLKTSFLLCIDELLKGGLEKGRWCLFYDRNQNIYNEEFNDSHLSLENYNAAKCTLQCNCRNTKPIGLTNSLLTHFPPARIIKEDGENVEYITFEDEKAFAKSLGTLIKKFKLESFNLSEITILSSVKYQNSRLLASKALHNICEVAWANNTKKSAVTFSTIQGFKGLDAKVVILTDIEKIVGHNFERLLYTGISRAKVKLFIFCSPETKEILDQRYLAGVKKLRQ